MMYEAWKKEAEYQLAKAILKNWAKKGLLTASETDSCLAIIGQEIKPPISDLKSPKTLDNTGF